MGVERLYKKTYLRREYISLPWIRIPTADPIALSGIVLQLQTLPQPDNEPERVFWGSLTEHVCAALKIAARGDCLDP